MASVHSSCKLKLLLAFIVLSLLFKSFAMAAAEDDNILSKDMLNKRPVVQPVETPYLDSPPKQYEPLKNASPLTTGNEIYAPEGEITVTKQYVKEKSKIDQQNQEILNVQLYNSPPRWRHYIGIKSNNPTNLKNKTTPATLNYDPFLSSTSAAVLQKNTATTSPHQDQETYLENIKLSVSPTVPAKSIFYGLEDSKLNIRYQIALIVSTQSNPSISYSGTSYRNNYYLANSDNTVYNADGSAAWIAGTNQYNSNLLCSTKINTIQEATSKSEQTIRNNYSNNNLSVELALYKDFKIQKLDKTRINIGFGVVLLSDAALKMMYESVVSARMIDNSAYFIDDPNFNYYNATNKDPYQGLNPQYDKDGNLVDAKAQNVTNALYNKHATDDGTKTEIIYSDDNGCAKAKSNQGYTTYSTVTTQPIAATTTNTNSIPKLASEPACLTDTATNIRCVYAKDAYGSYIYDENGNHLLVKPSVWQNDPDQKMKNTNYASFYYLKTVFNKSIANNIAPFLSLGVSYDVTNTITLSVDTKATMYNFPSKDITGKTTYTAIGDLSNVSTGGLTVNKEQNIRIKIPSMQFLIYSVEISFRYYL